MEKICRGCKLEKDLSEYGLNNKYKDGLQAKCRECIKNNVKLYVYTDENDCYVYRHLKPNGEVFYIGIGSGDNSYRRAKAKTGRNENWHSIVKEFGYEIQILTTGLSRREAEEIEILLIGYYKREDCCDGLLCNLTDGGKGNTGLKHSEETKRKMSEDRKGQRMGEDSPCYGKTLSKEHRKKLSISNKGRTWSEGQREKFIKTRTGCSVSEEAKKKTSDGLKKYYETHDGFSKGKPMAEETKKKLSDAHMGKVGLVEELNPMFGKIGELNPMWGKTHTEEVKQAGRERMWKKVINIETKEIFDCADYAGETIGMKGYTLQPHLRGESCTYLPFMYLEDYELGKTITLKENNRKIKPIINIDTLEIYESITQAAKATGITSISYHINNKTGKLPFMCLDEYRQLNSNLKQ